MSVLRSITRRFFSRAGKANSLPDISVLRAQPVPVEYWIELTSRCPFRCVFCSRAFIRGKGEHMDFGLYEALVCQMQDPTVIRLNYSGESIHYPRLAEAVRLAKSTGARVELVTALSSAQPDVVQALVKEGLDRMTVSIHAMEEPLYQAIYGYGSVDALRRNLDLVIRTRLHLNQLEPDVDIAFVAMERNLDQLMQVAALAFEHQIRQIDVHPVIRRDEIPESFSQELIAGSMTSNFRQRLSRTLAQTGARYPGVLLNVSSKELENPPGLGDTPMIYPPLLPAGARIHTCDQNPWETVHVLANGDIVTCEVQDHRIMGNLNEMALAAIWNGDVYKEFRRNYAAGRDKICQSCLYKQAYQPGPGLVLRTFLKPDICRHQLIQGWHEPETGFVWSSAKQSRAILARPVKGSIVMITGILPPGPLPDGNELIISIGRHQSQVKNSSRDLMSFTAKIPLKSIKEQTLVVEFRVSAFFSPDKTAQSTDARQLGFVLSEVQCH